MKKIILSIVMAIFCVTNSFCYTLEEVLLIYIVSVEHYLIDFHKLIMTNPNQNSYIHYGAYKFDSQGNKILDDFYGEEKEFDSSIYYKDGKMSGVRNGYNRWDFKIEGSKLVITHGRDSISSELNYISENELHCFGYKVKKQGNEFTVDAYKPYKFIFNDDTIDVIQLTKAGKPVYKYVYDKHGILLKKYDCYRFDSERLILSYSGVNGFIREESKLDKISEYTNDDFFRQIDKDGYLVYQNSDYSENNDYGYEELVILPCDDNDNILAAVDEIAVPYPNRETAGVYGKDTGRSAESYDGKEAPADTKKLIIQTGVISGIIFLCLGSITIVIMIKRKRNAKK